MRHPQAQRRSRRTLLLPIGLLGAIGILSAHGTERETARNAPIRYDRDVRPLLSDRCFRCHGPDAAQRKADLRLDEPASAAITPGDPLRSELWHRITSTDPDERMPPAHSNKRPFGPDELDLVRRWIEEGAEYEPHWSFETPRRPAVPRVEASEWVRDEVDAFVLAELERRGIEPSPEADRPTLLRRLFLDVTGLPPTLEELDAFLADTRPDAYERWVERLLHEEPYVQRYAERMSVPWLDAARYADTSGIHMDAGRQIWPWRDWVLAALRDGMPFDRFLTEQLAGDLLPDATQAQKVASGFNRNHVTTDEGGAISEEYLVEYAVDRASTTGSVFLGLTLGCARCHEHKYDPVSQEEFFSFYAYFNSVDEPGLYSQETDPQRAFEPFMTVPTPEQAVAVGELEGRLEEEVTLLEAPIEGEEEERAAFFAELLERTALEWVPAEVVAHRSTGGATLELQDDGSLLASGANPAVDTHVIELETAATDLRLVSLEALADPSLPDGRVGRAENGNAVLGSIRAEAISIADPTQRHPVRFVWAWADIEQMNGDFRVVNTLFDDGLGWAVDAHNQEGSRTALYLAEEPFGFEGGTRLVVQLAYDSIYEQHTFGRTRLHLGRIAPEGLDVLGAAKSGWYATAPFSAETGALAFETAFGPEEMARLDLTREFGPSKLRFNYIDVFLDERLNSELAGGINATYVAKRVFVPTAREVEVSLGSDDGFRLFLDGVEIAQNQVDRPLAADQDQVTIALEPGEHTLVMKVVNTGGLAGYYWRRLRRSEELLGDLLAAVLPPPARSETLDEKLRRAWRLEFSPTYRAQAERVAAVEAELAELSAGIPRTMVMKELEEPRETFVLRRGQYDDPDAERPVARGVPAALGGLPPGAPADRRGLAAWMTAPENPLVARVAVNRLWELCFGTGIVATSEDFGMQGEWPSHPELLDWLAVEYRESGWDTKALLTRLLTSSTYRQSSRRRPELTAVDPADRLLARYPRRRLGAEEIRDQALYVSGLLIERFGGPSVKPYQPPGLWQEVAMPQSNTRTYEVGADEELWRRSVYTYWKRASPPPSMLTFDAPTREFCTVRRGKTATPLQALVLWNDEQFVEAARVLAQRTLSEEADDEARLRAMFRRCTGRGPEADELAALTLALEDFRARYAAAPADAVQLLSVGRAPAPVPTLPDAEPEAETMSEPEAEGEAEAEVVDADVEAEEPDEDSEGEAPAPEAEPPPGPTPAELAAELVATLEPDQLRQAAELAAWTMIANALFSFDATICRG